jgi:glycerol-3-phosphate acyltransferase PlsY
MLTEFLIKAALIGYLLGSIPFGLLLSKAAGLGDIRNIGSGNIGATNVLRTGNKLLAFFTLLLDGGKGAAAIIIVIMMRPPACMVISCLRDAPCYCINDLIPYVAICGLFAILGHLYPIWLKFKGGKGVATTLGVLLCAMPTVGLACCAIWLLTAIIFRYSSLAALVAVISAAPLAHFIYAEETLTALCGVIALLVWFKHRSNVQRLIKGEEPKIGKGK